jgi:hypothetical protein
LKDCFHDSPLLELGDFLILGDRLTLEDLLTETTASFSFDSTGAVCGDSDIFDFAVFLATSFWLRLRRFGDGFPYSVKLRTESCNLRIFVSVSPSSFLYRSSVDVNKIFNMAFDCPAKFNSFSRYSILASRDPTESSELSEKTVKFIEDNY